MSKMTSKAEKSRAAQERIARKKAARGGLSRSAAQEAGLLVREPVKIASALERVNASITERQRVARAKRRRA